MTYQDWRKIVITYRRSLMVVAWAQWEPDQPTMTSIFFDMSGNKLLEIEHEPKI